MMDQHRCVKGTLLKINKTKAPFSCFSVLSNDYNNNSAIHRLFSLARSFDFQTFTVEDIPATGLILDENNEIFQTYGNDYEMAALQRLSFWKSSFKQRRSIGSQCDEDLIGYAILKKDVLKSNSRCKWHVFEAVFRKYQHKHNCVPNQQDYRLKIDGTIFNIPGVLYCQQNCINKACAQVALRSLLSRILPEGDIAYSSINQYAKEVTDDYDPKDGLGVAQIRHILQKCNVLFRDIDYVLSEKDNQNIRIDQPY